MKGKRETTRRLMIGAYIAGVAVLIASGVFAIFSIEWPEGFYVFAGSFIATFAAQYAARKTLFEKTFKDSITNDQAGPQV